MTMTDTTVPTWTLGDRINKARRHAGLEQGDLADACEVSRPLVSLWENDKAEPRANHVLVIAELTGVDAGWLLSGDQIRTGSFTTSAEPGADGNDMVAPFTPFVLGQFN